MVGRLHREELHGRWIAGHGEDVWNWSSPAGRYRLARRVEMFQQFLAGCRGRVLEVGCGTGLLTRGLAATGCEITAIDISEDLLVVASARVCDTNVTFARVNACATPFNDSQFSAIVGCSSLHHLEIDTALREFARLLHPGGGIMFTEPNMLNPQIFLQKNIPLLKRLAGDSPDETAFFRHTLAKSLSEAGFCNISIRPFDFLHPGLPGEVIPTARKIAARLETIPVLREFAGSLEICGYRR